MQLFRGLWLTAIDGYLFAIASTNDLTTKSIIHLGDFFMKTANYIPFGVHRFISKCIILNTGSFISVGYERGPFWTL